MKELSSLSFLINLSLLLTRIFSDAKESTFQEPILPYCSQEAGECKTPVFKDNKELKSNDDTFSGAISPDSGSHSDSQGEAKELEECPGDTPTDKTESIPPQKLNLSKLNAQSGSTMASLTSKKDHLEIDFNNFMVIEKRLSGRESPHSKQDYISED